MRGSGKVIRRSDNKKLQIHQGYYQIAVASGKADNEKEKRSKKIQIIFREYLITLLAKSARSKPGKITLVFQKKTFRHNIVGNETSLGRVYDLCILRYTEFEMIMDFSRGLCPEV